MGACTQRIVLTISAGRSPSGAAGVNPSHLSGLRRDVLQPRASGTIRGSAVRDLRPGKNRDDGSETDDDRSARATGLTLGIDRGKRRNPLHP